MPPCSRDLAFGRLDALLNARNEVTTITGVGEPTVTLTRDEIGSLTSDSDGLQGYYDAWGRLGVWSHVDFAASPPSVNAGFYQYDGLGRLCRRSAPWPTQASLSRVETYYHDGVRRIQEVFTDPVHAETPWADPYGTPPPAQTPQTRMEREYIWAAHETAGVNELHVAIDWFDREAWAIQDVHNQTVMGYTDAVGDLVEQRVYTPFGQILSADKTPLANPSGVYNDFRLRLGHHGLFADRLDADTTQPVLRHADARVICLTNTRVYVPTRGSWMQRDPYETAQVMLTNPYHSGMSMMPGLRVANIRQNYIDGANIYNAFGSNPNEHPDPLGLFLLPDVSSAAGLSTDLNQEMGEFGLGLVDQLSDVLNGWSVGHSAAIDIATETGGELEDGMFFSAGGLAAIGAGGRRLPGHHILPLAMGGINKAVNVLQDPGGKLPGHPQPLHKWMNQELRGRGLPALGGRGNTGEKWRQEVRRMIRKDPAVADKVRDALRTTARRYDRAYPGYNLVRETNRVLRASWTPRWLKAAGRRR